MSRDRDADRKSRGQPTEGPDVARQALAYLKLGWSVVPIRPRAKLPLIAWEAYQHQHATQDQIIEWFRRWPDANVGIVTGTISRLAVIDIDPRHGGADSLAALEQANGAVPRTVEAETGGGGRHLYFLAATTLHSRVGLAPGIDLRAEGGLVVAPPSVHPSGKRYAWREGCDPAAMALASMPQWLEELVREKSAFRGHPAWYWRDLLRAGVEEGVRNNTIASIAGHLLWHGVDPEIVTELLLCWNRVRCRPPLEDDEVVRISSSITRLHLRGERS